MLFIWFPALYEIKWSRGRWTVWYNLRNAYIRAITTNYTGLCIGSSIFQTFSTAPEVKFSPFLKFEFNQNKNCNDWKLWLIRDCMHILSTELFWQRYLSPKNNFIWKICKTGLILVDFPHFIDPDTLFVSQGWSSLADYVWNFRKFLFIYFN